jgi:hypothetical protein
MALFLFSYLVSSGTHHTQVLLPSKGKKKERNKKTVSTLLVIRVKVRCVIPCLNELIVIIPRPISLSVIDENADLIYPLTADRIMFDSNSAPAFFGVGYKGALFSLLPPIQKTKRLHIFQIPLFQKRMDYHP